MSSSSYTQPPQHLPPTFPEIPPFFIHAYEFLLHFVFFFLVPVATVAFSALFAAALVQFVYRKIISRYATPEELYSDALNQLKKTEDSRRALNRPSSSSREGALDSLRLVIQLQPEMIEAYTVLATELFYGDISSDESGGDDNQRWKRISNDNSRSTLKRRGVHLKQTNDNNLSPKLIECQKVIDEGLAVEPKNEALQKLKNELKLVNEYGRSGAHTKMMNIGSFGFVSG